MEYIYNIYNFLNNTQGYLELYQLKFLCDFMQIDFDCVSKKDFTNLSSLIEAGDKEERFFEYLVELKNKHGK